MIASMYIMAVEDEHKANLTLNVDEFTQGAKEKGIANMINIEAQYHEHQLFLKNSTKQT